MGIKSLLSFVIGPVGVLLCIGSAIAVPVALKSGAQDCSVLRSREVLLYPSCRGNAAVSVGHTTWHFRDLKPNYDQPLAAMFVVVRSQNTGTILEAWPAAIVGGSGRWAPPAEHTPKEEVDVSDS